MFRPTLSLSLPAPPVATAARASAPEAADQVVLDQAGLPQPGRTLRAQARLW